MKTSPRHQHRPSPAARWFAALSSLLLFLSDLAAADRRGDAGGGGTGGGEGEDDVHGGALPLPLHPRLHAAAPGKPPPPAGCRVELT